MKKNTVGNLLLLLTSLIWGAAFVVQSLGMNYLRPFAFNGIRTMIAGITLLPVIFFMRRNSAAKMIITGETVLGGIACGICLFLATTIQQFGIMTTTAGKAGFITALYVLFVPVIGIMMHKKIHKVVWVCICLAVVGFYLLCVENNFSVSKGDLLCLLGSLFFSMHIITIDYFTGKNIDPVIMSCIQFFTVGLLSVVPMLIFEDPDPENILKAKWAILYTGVLSAGVGYTLQIIGQKRTEPAAATLILSLESVFSALFGWIFLKENLTVKEASGSVIVFAAVILAQLIPQKRDSKL